MTYYGYRCYDQDEVAIGWLYTANSEREYNWTNNPKNLSWCKRWKTEKGAQKSFEWYNKQWQFRTKGGYLKIEVMPEIPETPPQSRVGQEPRDVEYQESNNKSTNIFDIDNSVWSFQPPSELIHWLEEERYTLEDGTRESNADLLIRKLKKLKNLEQQGY